MLKRTNHSVGNVCIRLWCTLRCRVHSYLWATTDLTQKHKITPNRTCVKDRSLEVFSWRRRLRGWAPQFQLQWWIVDCTQFGGCGARYESFTAARLTLPLVVGLGITVWPSSLVHPLYLRCSWLVSIPVNSSISELREPPIWQLYVHIRCPS